MNGAVPNQLYLFGKCKLSKVNNDDGYIVRDPYVVSNQLKIMNCASTLPFPNDDLLFVGGWRGVFEP